MDKIYECYSTEDWKRTGEDMEFASKEEEGEILDACRKEIDRLSDFILAYMPEEIGKGDFVRGESAVDVAIRLLSQLKGIEPNETA